MGKDATSSEPVRRRPGILHSTFGHILIGIVAAVLVGMVVWGATTVSANRRVAAERGRLATMSRNYAIREAQTHLYESAIELERRNFGTADARLKQAGTSLAAVPRGVGSADSDARIERIRQGISTIDLTVASDVSTQRNQILDFAQQAGELVSAG